LNRKSIDTTPEIPPYSLPSKKPALKPSKPFYNSIIAITAAIVLQNYWRDYRRRKIAGISDPE